jgi:hypothetical protein
MPRNHFDKRKKEDERRERHARKIEMRLARKKEKLERTRRLEPSA